jgi:hypothetical protein
MGVVSVDQPVRVQFFSEEGSGEEYVKQYIFSANGEHQIADLPFGNWEVEAFIDLNDTALPESQFDAFAGRTAALYDDFQVTSINVKEGAKILLPLRLLHPIQGIAPASGDTATGRYTKFEWKTDPRTEFYHVQVVRNDKTYYKVKIFGGSVTYGDVPQAAVGHILQYPEVLSHDEWYRWEVVGFTKTGSPASFMSSRRFIP